MICFPNCKINIGLNILNKREDVFHGIQSVFYPVPITDALEISQSKETTISIYGAKIQGDPTSNLIYKAWELLNAKHQIGPVAISLLKKIPSGGGLGGGSADGSFMLNLLNDFFKLDLSLEKREYYAAILGSDCPFFIKNKPAIVTGRGENVRPVNLDLAGYHLLLVNPKIHISTQVAFQIIAPKNQLEFDADAIESLNLDYWNSHLINDFENPILRKYPEIKVIKDQIKNLGAFYTSLSGTGSTYFGLFKDKPNTVNLFPNCDVWQVQL